MFFWFYLFRFGIVYVAFPKELKGDLAVLGKAIVHVLDECIVKAVPQNVLLKKIVIEKVPWLVTVQWNELKRLRVTGNGNLPDEQVHIIRTEKLVFPLHEGEFLTRSGTWTGPNQLWQVLAFVRLLTSRSSELNDHKGHHLYSKSAGGIFPGYTETGNSLLYQSQLKCQKSAWIADLSRPFLKIILFNCFIAIRMELHIHFRELLHEII